MRRGRSTGSERPTAGETRRADAVAGYLVLGGTARGLAPRVRRAGRLLLGVVLLMLALACRQPVAPTVAYVTPGVHQPAVTAGLRATPAARAPTPRPTSTSVSTRTPATLAVSPIATLRATPTPGATPAPTPLPATPTLSPPSPTAAPRLTPAATASAGSVPGNGGTECPAGYPIKGNISSKGEKIYHTDASRTYKVTKPEECFATEQDALAAGYRKAKD